MTALRILVTGSSGLIGRALVMACRAQGDVVRELDLRAEDRLARGDVRDAAQLRHRLGDCDGIVHLAAMSRIVAAERYPALCWSTNVDGLKTVIAEARLASRRPWLIFASSREVYGQPARLPVVEDAPLAPVNVYGRSKVAGERLIEEARRQGLRACTVRLSNVFGSVADHADRVIPAFVRAALENRPLRVEGRDHTFDFTHLGDVTRGLLALARHLAEGTAPPPPLHFVSGVPTTLGALAETTVTLAGSRSVLRQAPPRTFDVNAFVGDGARARAVLGWGPEVTLREGLERLITEFRATAKDSLSASLLGAV